MTKHLTARRFRLTTLEREILAHRLAVPDCIAEVLRGDGDDPFAGYAIEDVETVCELLTADKLQEAEAINDSLVKDVLADCVEGSTYLAATVSSEVESPQKLTGIFRAGESLARKISEYVGRKLEYPSC